MVTLLIMSQFSNKSIASLSIITILIFVIGYCYLDLAIAQLLWEKGKFLYPYFQQFTSLVDGVFGGALFFQAAPQSKLLTLIAFRPLLLGLLFIVFYYVFKQKKVAFACLIAAPTWLLSSITTGLLKSFTQRPRPLSHFPIAELDSNLVEYQGFYDSFPSGHVADYMSLFLPFALFFPRYSFYLLQIPFWIAVGRLVLFMHFFTDVLGSALIVLCFASLFYKVYQCFNHSDS
jgi:membrane-associated phospholipid phosphatase